MTRRVLELREQSAVGDLPSVETPLRVADGNAANRQASAWKRRDLAMKSMMLTSPSERRRPREARTKHNRTCIHSHEAQCVNRLKSNQEATLAIRDRH